MIDPTIVDLSALPIQRAYCRIAFTDEARDNYELVKMKKRIADRIAELIMSNEKFFKATQIGDSICLEGTAVVMSEKETIDVLVEQYTRGRRYGMYTPI